MAKDDAKETATEKAQALMDAKKEAPPKETPPKTPAKVEEKGAKSKETYGPFKTKTGKTAGTGRITPDRKRKAQAGRATKSGGVETAEGAGREPIGRVPTKPMTR